LGYGAWQKRKRFTHKKNSESVFMPLKRHKKQRDKLTTQTCGQLFNKEQLVHKVLPV